MNLVYIAIGAAVIGSVIGLLMGTIVAFFKGDL